MGRQYTTRGAQSVGRLAGLLLVSALLGLFLLSPVRAQETPNGAQETPVDDQETPVDAAETLVRIEIDGPPEPIPKGEEFEARVLVENVEHLAGFDFTIKYDPKRVQPVEVEASQEETAEATPAAGLAGDDSSFVRVLDIGAFLSTSDRSEGLFCSDPVARDDTVLVSCVTLGPPFCLDGLPGASGSGLLGRVVFKSKGGGSTTLELTESTLALDDVVPCDPEKGAAQRIPHRRQDASIELESGGGFPWVIVGAIIGVVAVVVIGGGFGGYLWYRRRGAGTAP